MTFGTQVVIAGIISTLLGMLKKSSWFPWITAETSKVNRVVAIALSFLGTAGIHFAWNASSHSLTITGLALWPLLTFLWHGVAQSYVTHFYYKLTNSKLFPLVQQLAGALSQVQAQPATKAASVPGLGQVGRA